MKRTTAQNIIRIIRRAGTIASGICTIVVASAILTAPVEARACDSIQQETGVATTTLTYDTDGTPFEEYCEYMRMVCPLYAYDAFSNTDAAENPVAYGFFYDATYGFRIYENNQVRTTTSDDYLAYLRGVLTANDLMTSSQSLRVTCETNTSISVAVGDNFSDRFSASGTYTLDKLTFEITDDVFFETV